MTTATLQKRSAKPLANGQPPEPVEDDRSTSFFMFDYRLDVK